MNIRDAPDHDKIRFVHALFQFLIAELARCLSRSILSRSRRRNRLICVTQHMPQLFYRDARAKNPTVGIESCARSFLERGGIFCVHRDAIAPLQRHRRGLFQDRIHAHDNRLRRLGHVRKRSGGELTHRSRENDACFAHQRGLVVRGLRRCGIRRAAQSQQHTGSPQTASHEH